MRYISSPSNDAYFNMAFEEYVFESLSKEEEYFLLWQNANTIVVGKYQNTIEEINQEFVREKGIQVVRRLSGGGAMYQDLGNLNFTFIVNQNTNDSLDFSIFIKPVIRALAQIGVTAEFNSRNDIVIDGRKFSGNSQYNKKGRTMHHGTLLFNSDLNVIQNALQVKADKIESKGVKSVRSRVTNILEHMEKEITLEEFRQVLLTHMFDQNETLSTYELTEADLAGIERLKEEKYATWDWNYGRSPDYNLRKERKFDFGLITVLMGASEGKIDNVHFYGDFFGNGGIEDLEEKLKGCSLQEEELKEALSHIDVGYYISGMDAGQLVELLLY